MANPAQGVNLTNRNWVFNVFLQAIILWDEAASRKVFVAQAASSSGEKAVVLLMDSFASNSERSIFSEGLVEPKNGAASMLGINPGTLRRRMKRLRIQYDRGSHIKR